MGVDLSTLNLGIWTVLAVTIVVLLYFMWRVIELMRRKDEEQLKLEHERMAITKRETEDRSLALKEERQNQAALTKSRDDWVQGLVDLSMGQSKEIAAQMSAIATQYAQSTSVMAATNGKVSEALMGVKEGLDRICNTLDAQDRGEERRESEYKEMGRAITRGQDEIRRHLELLSGEGSER